MKEKGWLYCSGCRQKITQWHWHKVYEQGWDMLLKVRQQDFMIGLKFFAGLLLIEKEVVDEVTAKEIWEKENRRSIIDWDVAYDEVDGKEIRDNTVRPYSDPEIAEKEYCADHHLCMSCKKPLKGEWRGGDWHAPYWIPACHGYFWCTECYSGPTHAYCPHSELAFNREVKS